MPVQRAGERGEGRREGTAGLTLSGGSRRAGGPSRLWGESAPKADRPSDSVGLFPPPRLKRKLLAALLKANYKNCNDHRL